MQKFLLIFENIVYWLTVFLLVFIPLYPKFPLFNVKGTFVAIRLEDLLVALAIILWVLLLILKKNLSSFFKDKLSQSLLLFFFIGGLSVFSGLFLTHTITFNLGFLHYLRRVEYMILLPVAYSAVKNRKQVITILAVLLSVVLIVNLYALGQKYLGWPVVSTTNSEFSKGLILYLTPGARVNSTFAGHYDLAVFLTMAIVILSAMIFYFKKLWIRISCLLISSLSFLVLVMTAARLSFVATIVGAIGVLILTGKRIFILIIIALTIGALVFPNQLRDRFVSTLTVNVLKEGERYIPEDDDQQDRSQLNIQTLPTKPLTDWTESTDSATTSGKMASDITPGEPTDTTQLGVYRSFGIRLNLEWPRAIRAFYKNPFLGTGYSSLGLATDNDFLRLLGEVGLLGTLSFGLVFFEIGKRMWKNFRSKDKFVKYLSAGALSMMIAFLLNGLFIDVFEASKVAMLFWMFLGISLALEKVKNDV